MSDYMFVIESHLDAAQNRTVAEIQRIATEAGMNVWLAGGAMRDILRGSAIRDLDFTVERDAVKLGKSLAHAMKGRVIAEDGAKRSVELELPGGVRASVSNARTEKYSKPGGKPLIAPATIHDDLLRRDFTINAIALSLNRGSRGLLIDPANGQADLMNKELRATNPYIFFDDPSRIFRLIRFQYVLGFQISPRAQSQLENALMEGYQTFASPGALAVEIRALSGDANAVAALEALDRHGLLKLLSPALTGPKLNTAGLARLEKALHSAISPGTSDGWLAFLTVLTEKLSPRDRADLIKAFELSRSEADRLKKLDAKARKLESALKSAKIHKPSQVYEVLETAAVDEVLLVLYRSVHRVVQDRIRAFYHKYLPQAQEITEEQVAAESGVKPGSPKFQKVYRTQLLTHLNARPRKVPPPDPEPAAAPGPMPMAMARNGRK